VRIQSETKFKTFKMFIFAIIGKEMREKYTVNEKKYKEILQCSYVAGWNIFWQISESTKIYEIHTLLICFII